MISQAFNDFVCAYAMIADRMMPEFTKDISLDDLEKVKTYCGNINRPTVGGRYFKVSFETARNKFYGALRELKVSEKAMTALDQAYTAYQVKVQKMRSKA